MNKLKTIFRSLHWKNILGLTIAGLIQCLRYYDIFKSC